MDNIWLIDLMEMIKLFRAGARKRYKGSEERKAFIESIMKEIDTDLDI